MNAALDRVIIAFACRWANWIGVGVDVKPKTLVQCFKTGHLYRKIISLFDPSATFDGWREKVPTESACVNNLKLIAAHVGRTTGRTGWYIVQDLPHCIKEDHQGATVHAYVLLILFGYYGMKPNAKTTKCISSSKKNIMTSIKRLKQYEKIIEKKTEGDSTTDGSEKATGCDYMGGSTDDSNNNQSQWGSEDPEQELFGISSDAISLGLGLTLVYEKPRQMEHIGDVDVASAVEEVNTFNIELGATERQGGQQSSVDLIWRIPSLTTIEWEECQRYCKQMIRDGIKHAACSTGTPGQLLDGTQGKIGSTPMRASHLQSVSSTGALPTLTSTQFKTQTASSQLLLTSKQLTSGYVPNESPYIYTKPVLLGKKSVPCYSSGYNDGPFIRGHHVVPKAGPKYGKDRIKMIVFADTDTDRDNQNQLGPEEVETTSSNGEELNESIRKEAEDIFEHKKGPSPPSTPTVLSSSTNGNKGSKRSKLATNTVAPNEEVCSRETQPIVFASPAEISIDCEVVESPMIGDIPKQTVCDVPAYERDMQDTNTPGLARSYTQPNTGIRLGLVMSMLVWTALYATSSNPDVEGMSTSRVIRKLVKAVCRGSAVKRQRKLVQQMLKRGLGTKQGKEQTGGIADAIVEQNDKDVGVSALIDGLKGIRRFGGEAVVIDGSVVCDNNRSLRQMSSILGVSDMSAESISTINYSLLDQHADTNRSSSNGVGHSRSAGKRMSSASGVPSPTSQSSQQSRFCVSSHHAVSHFTNTRKVPGRIDINETGTTSRPSSAAVVTTGPKATVKGDCSSLNNSRGISPSTPKTRSTIGTTGHKAEEWRYDQRSAVGGTKVVANSNQSANGTETIKAYVPLCNVVRGTYEGPTLRDETEGTMVREVMAEEGYQGELNGRGQLSLVDGLRMFIFGRKANCKPTLAHVFISDRGKIGPALYWKVMEGGAKLAGVPRCGCIHLLEIGNIMLHLSKGRCETPLRPYLELLPDAKSFSCGVCAMRVSLGPIGEKALGQLGTELTEAILYTRRFST